ncbi:MAG: TniQ family protein [Thiomonas arsenitoxydans]|uniref:TniQ family protein n=2 Tax=Thiomonas arsenitoxydans (strain DSM 22701 / CIP 110005 / 3As) TaxID=426114 RepID=A0A8I1SY87_THIA3|nr:TniQ family protein [Thiomonas arsenitoxydans]
MAQMLAYFPTVYPGELLYSVLARYHRHVGAPSPMHTLDALFGNRKVIATFDLPGHLQALADRIPPDRALNVDRIIDTLTLYPYLTAFEPPALQEKVRRAMGQGAIDGLHVCLGLSAFRIGRVQQLRFCQTCAWEMKAIYGELWWRRDHQLPGVIVCPEHGCPLQGSTVRLAKVSRHEFVAATPNNCPSHARSIAPLMEPASLAHLQRVARRSADLLCSPPGGRTLWQWTEFYRNRMLEIGLSKSNVTMNQYHFDRDFRNFFGGALDLLPAVMDDGAFAGDWLASMVRKHRKAHHPLHHILVQDFLAQRERRDSAFGAGPWPCINPLANHRSSEPIKSFTQHWNHGNRVGVFSCSCGYVYTRCLQSKTGALGAPRFLQYGPLLEPALRQLVIAGKRLREVGRFLHLDPKTVVRLAGEIGIAIPWKPLRRIEKVLVSPESVADSAASLVQASPAVPVTRDVARRTRRAWPEIDRDWVTKLSAWVDIVCQESPPVRITVAELERRANRRDWLLKRRHHMPLTMEFLDQAVETVEQFQLRRIHWAIAELELCGAPVTAWQIMRKAGLRSNNLARIHAILDEAPIVMRIAA